MPDISHLGGFDLLHKAQEMQQKMKEIQEDFSKELVIGEAGGGLVKVVANCRHEYKTMFVDPSLLKEQPETAQDVIVAAFNDASNKAKSRMKEKMLNLSKELGLPENFSGDESGN